MGKLVEFQKAKDRILGQSTQQINPQSNPDLEKQLEKFSFSRLPKRERIAQILVQSLSAQVTFIPTSDTPENAVPYLLSVSGVVDFLAVADLIEKYAPRDFTEPFQRDMFQDYVPPTVDLTVAEE